MGWVWYWLDFVLVWLGLVWNGLVCSIMSNASLCFILDKGLETFLEIYILWLPGYKNTAPIGLVKSEILIGLNELGFRYNLFDSIE